MLYQIKRGDHLGKFQILHLHVSCPIPFSFLVNKIIISLVMPPLPLYTFPRQIFHGFGISDILGSPRIFIPNKVLPHIWESTHDLLESCKRAWVTSLVLPSVALQTLANSILLLLLFLLFILYTGMYNILLSSVAMRFHQQLLIGSYDVIKIQLLCMNIQSWDYNCN